jgi:hypothetical protein
MRFNFVGLNHVLSKDLAILIYKRLHNKLHKHFLALARRRLFYNFLLCRFVVKLAPKKLFKRVWVHTQLFSNLGCEAGEGECPVIIR